MHAGWASPPLLFGLAPRGVFRAPDVTTRAVGSYPTFSPLPNALDRKRPASGFAEGRPPRCKLTGGLIFCGTFRSSAASANSQSQPPGVTRRVAPPWPTLASSPRPESGLSSRPPLARATGDRPAHPPSQIIRWRSPRHNPPPSQFRTRRHLIMLFRGSELQFTLNEVKGSDICREERSGFSP